MPDHDFLPDRRLLLLGTAGAAFSLMTETSSGAPAPAGQMLAREKFPPRYLPARSLPVPDTVSPVLRERIAAPLPPGWDVIPQSVEDWRAMAAASSQSVMPFIEDIRAQFRLTITEKRLGGVPVFDIVPPEIAPENRNRLVMHVHGGAYALYPGLAGAGEGMLMAGHGRIRVISVDYRMAPDFPYPAAVDDALAVWRPLLAERPAQNMAMLGTSAGGGLTLATIMAARQRNIPLPAAMAPGTPYADLTMSGDSAQANAYVDNVLVSTTGWVGAAGAIYTAGHDPRDPLISPLFGDFSGLPPAILTSGTRDMLLSDTVRVHRKLRQAGVEARLNVFEGQSHGQYLDHTIPECAEAFAEISAFFDAHLAR